jgi:ubiquinone biosynthesis protein COQ4
MPASHPPLDVPRALRALRALFADPDDLPQVFTIVESLAGRTLARMERRFGQSESGVRILATRPDIVPLLAARDALRALPEGSVGRAYLAFVESEGISPEGILEADAEGRTGRVQLPDAQRYLHQRMRDTHDLWHAITGYRGDVLGEAGLLAFTLAQSWNFGVALIVGLGLVKTSGNKEARRVIVEGYRRGRRAAWFPAQEWETLLGRPVSEVREQLHVGAPPVYTPVRSAELKMAQAA